MNIKELFAQDRAVSPVIGVILMVAITVILAAVIGAFVIGLGDGVSDTAPNANIQFDIDGNNSVEIRHGGGDSIDESNIRFVVNETREDSTEWASNDRVRSGDSITLGEDGDQMQDDQGDWNDGDRIQVIWDNGDRSSVIGEARF